MTFISTAIRGPCGPSRVPSLAVLLAAVLTLVPTRAQPLDYSGIAQLTWASDQSDDFDTSSLEQRYGLNLRQSLTNFLNLHLGYSYLDFGTKDQSGIATSRRTQTPRLTLGYNRDNLTASLLVRMRSTDLSATLPSGPSITDASESRSLLGTIGWRKPKYPSFNLTYRRGFNVADSGALGEGTDQESLGLTVRYVRPYWSTRYTFNRSELENAINQFRSNQDRHNLWLNGSRRFFDERLSVGLNGSIGHVTRTSIVGPDTEIAEPIPPARGLYAIDTSPELGELLTTPGLIDGDFVNPSPPGIDVGGANTFRNVGVDLGFTLPVSRLEVTVDRPSQPGLLWRVYHSRDNLIWEEVSGVSSSWDAEFLRYTLRFPETTDRFFKAVNVSVNVAALVQVTEVRTLRDVTPESEDTESDLYRLNGSASFDITPRMNASVNFGTRNDENVVAGIVRRGFSSTFLGARFFAGLPANLSFNLGYTLGDREDRLRPELDRGSQSLSARLNWVPLPTVEGLLAVTAQEESNRDTLLQAQKSARLSLILQLLPDLRLASGLRASRLEDPFAGRDRYTYQLDQRLEAVPTATWTIGGGYVYSLNESVEGDELLRRLSVDLRTDWAATPILTLTGAWRYSTDNNTKSIRQNYGISYLPGPKLQASFSYSEFSTDPSERFTEQYSAFAGYRLNRWLRISGTLSSSSTGALDSDSTRTTSARVGLTITF